MDLHRKLGTAFQSFLLAALLFAGIAVKGYSQQSAFKPAPANPSFVEYMQRVETQGLTAAPQTAGGYGLGYIPSPIDFSYLRGKRIFPQEKDFSILAFPTTYDLRTLGRLTPVRNQGIHGTCWAFATYGSLESWLLTDEVAEWNFSENNLANLHGWDLDGFLDGGLVQMAIAYLTRWSGPVNEADDTYDAAGNSRIGASTGSETVQKHVQQVLVLPPRDNPLDNDNIKDAVTNYGGVYTSMYMEYPSVYYDETNDAYYYDGAVDSNHAVVIVGWDDDFDKTKFDTEPAGNGAFIVRNSWGSAWGEGGYFYISYYDSNIGYEENVVFNSAEPVDNYSYVYRYDPLGLVLPFGDEINDTAWFSNIFTAVDNQKIKAVSFYALAVDSGYEIYVYTGVTAGLPVSGTLSSTKTGIISAPGYHTVVLDNLVTATPGQRFSVVIKITTPGWGWPVPVEFPYPGFTSNATANSGESFVSEDGLAWVDMVIIEPNANVCIKAFAETPPPVPILTVTPVSLDFGLLDNSLTFFVDNTGEATLDWEIGAFIYNEGSGWIDSVLPLSGTTDTETDIVTVTVNRAGLSSGTYTATIPLSSNGGNENVEVTVRIKLPPDKPVNISPANGATNVSRTPVLTASEYSDPDDDPMLVARWRIKKDGEIVWNSNNVSNSIEVTAGTILNYSTTYTWQVRYANSYGLESEWSDETSFTTRAKPQTNPNSPTNISPANLATGVALNPILMASAFSDPDGDVMNDSHWRIRTETEAYEIASVWEAENAGATNSIVVTTALAPNTRYFWQVRYQDTDGLWSAWSTETMFTTLTGSEDDEDDGEGDWVEGGSSGGGCFIATAAYGTPMAAQVVKLKNFRDSHLLKNRVGRAFVKWYYRNSPPVAEYIRQRKAAKMLVRAGLRPFLWLLSFK